MKNAITLLIFITLLGSATAQNSRTSSIMGAKVENHAFVYHADSVTLDFALDISQLDINSNESLVLTPTISDDTHSESLPTIILRGRSSAKSYKRAEKVGGKREVARYEELYANNAQVVDVSIGELQAVEYQYTLPYHVWMANSNFAITSELYSCCCSEDAGAITALENRLYVDIPQVERYEFVPRMQLIKPEKVAVKRRDVQYSSRVVFRVNSAVLDAKLANNEQEFKLIDQMMHSVVSDDDYTVTSINIVGYASPEGTASSNEILSQKRASAIERMLVDKYSLNRRLYSVRFGGENWDDLIPMVQESEMNDKGTIVEIIRSVAIEDGRESRLMALQGGSSYKYMLSNYFPALRKVDIDVEYNVDAYDLEKIREVIKTKPQNLSLEEMYRLSETYSVDSEEFLQIFLTAARLYPEDQTALHNVVVSELHAGNMAAAGEYIAQINDESTSKETINLLGVYYTLEGDYTTAESYLQRAIFMGCHDAKYNYDQMRKAQEADLQIEEANALRSKIYGQVNTTN